MEAHASLYQNQYSKERKWILLSKDSSQILIDSPIWKLLETKQRSKRGERGYTACFPTWKTRSTEQNEGHRGSSNAGRLPAGTCARCAPLDWVNEHATLLLTEELIAHASSLMHPTKPLKVDESVSQMHKHRGEAGRFGKTGSLQGQGQNSPLQ